MSCLELIAVLILISAVPGSILSDNEQEYKWWHFAIKIAIGLVLFAIGFFIRTNPTSGV